MAKQHVSFVERHLEKIALGVAGAVLLGAGTFYLAGSPHAVVVKNKSYGPAEFYQQLGREVQTARESIRNAGGGDYKDAKQELRRMLESAHQPPRTIEVAAVNLNAPVEVPPDDLPGSGKVKLARVLSPTTPLITTGRAYCYLPRTETIPVVATEADAPGTMRGSSLLTPQQQHWVTLCFSISRRAQKDEFRSASYMPERLELIVVDVSAERQERLPNGLWSEPEPAVGYHEQRIAIKKKIELVANEDNELGVAPEDATYLTACRSKFGEPQAQADRLRPDFQQLLATGGADDKLHPWKLEWQVPKELQAPDGTMIDLTLEDYRIEFPAAEEAVTIDAAWIRDTLKQAEQDLANVPDVRGLLDKKDYRQVKTLAKAFMKIQDRLETVSKASAATDRQKEQANELVTKYKADFDRMSAAVTLSEDRLRDASTSVSELGENVEPAWLTDTDVEPGKTYRYRVRLAALNQYAGMANLLDDPQNAGLLVVEGEWSEWSAPVTVRPDKYLFFTRGQRNRNSARVELYEWAQGEWISGGTELQPGDRVVFRRGQTQIDYGAVVASVEFDQPYQERLPERTGDGFKYKSVVTDILTLVDADGLAEQRFNIEDLDARRRIKPIIDREKELYGGEEETPEAGKATGAGG